MDLQLKEIIVTLYRTDDLESFYEDMAASTDNGNDWIPDRPVKLAKKRPIIGTHNSNRLKLRQIN